MDLDFAADDIAFREEVRGFLAAELPADLAAAGRNCPGIYCEYPAANRWFRILAKRGWSVPHWHVAYGGTGWTPMAEAGAFI